MKDKFGFNQVTTTTPPWAKWLFRIVFFLNKIVAGYIAATNLISPEAKYEVTLFLVLIIDPFAYGFSKMFGVEIDQQEENSNVVMDVPPDIAGGGTKNDPPTKP